MHQSFAALLLGFIVTITAAAQVVETPSGRLEFIGLKRRNAQQLWDTIASLAPGKGANECASILREQLHFADASVVLNGSNPDDFYWVVTAIEPEDSARVHYLTPPRKAQPDAKDWGVIARTSRSGMTMVQATIYTYGPYLVNKPDSARVMLAQYAHQYRAMTGRTLNIGAAIDTVWRTLATRRQREDKARALKTLATDGNENNRVAAVMILANFPDDDGVWQALMNAQRDRSTNVQSAAGSVLNIFITYVPRTVDWAPAKQSIRYILNGTNLFAFLPTAKVLHATQVSPGIAAGLLAHNGDLVTAYMASDNAEGRTIVHNLLYQLSGNDYGLDAAGWKDWIDTLHE